MLTRTSLPRPLTTLASVLFAASLLTSCDGSQSSPLAPSAMGPGPGAAPGTATIQGQVNPGGGRMSSSVVFTAASHDDDSITVTVMGTNLVVEVHGGQFMIANVPPGVIQLLFDGPGGQATLEIGSVEADEILELVVILEGNTATLQSLNSHNDSDDDNSEDHNDDASDDDSSDDDSDDDDSDDDSSDDDSSDDDSDDDDSSDDASDDSDD